MVEEYTFLYSYEKMNFQKEMKIFTKNGNIFFHII